MLDVPALQVELPSIVIVVFWSNMRMIELSLVRV
jgi:hypothetical protein